MDNKIIHFEQLWEMCEKISSSNFIDDKEIIGRITSVIDEIKDIYLVAPSSKDKKIVQEIKSKALGRLLMNIAALSNKENIDIYSSMKDQFDILKLRDSVSIKI